MAEFKSLGEKLSFALNLIKSNVEQNYQKKANILYTGDEAPSEDDANLILWVDTSEKEKLEQHQIDALTLAQSINKLTSRVDSLEDIFDHQLYFGNFTNNATASSDDDDVEPLEPFTTIDNGPTTIVQLENGEYKKTSSATKTREFERTESSVPYMYKQVITTIDTGTYSDISCADKYVIESTENVVTRETITNKNMTTNAYDADSDVSWTQTEITTNTSKLINDVTILNADDTEIASLKKDSITVAVKTVKTISDDSDSSHVIGISEDPTYAVTNTFNSKTVETLDNQTIMESYTPSSMIKADDEYTLSNSYIVGCDNLTISIDGIDVTKNVKYTEIGDNGEESNVVKFLSSIDANSVIKFTINNKVTIINYQTIVTNLIVNTELDNSEELHFARATNSTINEKTVTCYSTTNDANNFETEHTIDVIVAKDVTEKITKTETSITITYGDEENIYNKTTVTSSVVYVFDTEQQKYIKTSSTQPTTVVEDTNSLSEDSTPNGKHLRIKTGKYTELKEIIDSGNIPFLSGELLYCYDTNQLFAVTPYQKVVQISSSNNEGSSEEAIEVDLSNVEEIGFTANISSSTTSTKYIAKVNSEGDFTVLPESIVNAVATAPATTASTDVIAKNLLNNPQTDFYLSKNLYINSFYAGGLTATKFDYNKCDYNFVEIGNLTNKTIPLKGLSLQYAASGSDDWTVLPLEGVIKPYSTFLVRGAQCAYTDANTTVIKVGKPDMEWYRTVENTRELVAFSTVTCKIILMYGTEKYNKVNPTYSSSAVEYGLIDFVGAQGSGGAVDGYDVGAYTSLSADRLYTKYFTMDWVSQATSSLAMGSRGGTKNWYYVDLYSADPETGINSVGINVKNYTPKASSEGKNIFYNKSSIDSSAANMVTCTFGINATDPNSYEFDEDGNITKIFDYDGNLKYSVTNGKYTDSNGTEISEDDLDYGATRCFNWISKDYYDEFLFYRKKGSNDAFTKVESFKLVRNSSTGLDEFSSRLSRYKNTIYNRQRVVATNNECFTTHKYILPHIVCPVSENNGIVYEYYCGKADCKQPSEDNIFTFTVRNSHNIDDFAFIHVTDQQGFNHDEYVVWKKLADYIAKKESYEGYETDFKVAGEKTYTAENNDDIFTKATGSTIATPTSHGFDFCINTGDMTQNGNRLNEWLDYYNCGLSLMKDYEQMAVIGNNDLCTPNYQGFENQGDGSDSAKENGINFQFFFTFEFPLSNRPFVQNTATNDEYYIHSLYSFNYGRTHFLAVNSEITDLSNGKASATKYGQGTIPDFYHGVNAYETMKKWCETDYANMPSYIKWKIAFCHEMPFTILTAEARDSAVANGSTDRGGSHLNSVYGKFDTTQFFWFSRFLENYGYQLCLGGHKHTYSLSRNLRENYKFIWTGSDDLTDLDGNIVFTSRIDKNKFENDDDLYCKESQFYTEYTTDGQIKLNEEIFIVKQLYNKTKIRALIDSGKFLAGKFSGKSDEERDALLNDSDFIEEYLEPIFTNTYSSIDFYPRNLLKNGIIKEESLTETLNKISAVKFYSSKAIVQVSSKYFDDSTTFKNPSEVTSIAMCQLENVEKYNAPVYSMLQASGYKQTSNKELPGANNPWLRAYYPAKETYDSASNTYTKKAVAGQKYPFYSKVSIFNNYIRADFYRGENIMNNGSFSINSMFDETEKPVLRILGNGSAEYPLIISDENTQN